MAAQGNRNSGSSHPVQQHGDNKGRGTGTQLPLRRAD
jgi:hypothetical protein